MEHLVEHMRVSYHSMHEPMCGICKKHFRSFESLREHLMWPLPKIDTKDVLFICDGAFVDLEGNHFRKIENCPRLGSLPEELGQLKALQTLKVENCPRLGSLPEELEQFTALQKASKRKKSLDFNEDQENTIKNLYEKLRN